VQVPGVILSKALGQLALLYSHLVLPQLLISSIFDGTSFQAQHCDRNSTAFTRVPPLGLNQAHGTCVTLHGFDCIPIFIFMRLAFGRSMKGFVTILNEAQDEQHALFRCQCPEVCTLRCNYEDQTANLQRQKIPALVKLVIFVILVLSLCILFLSV